MERFQNNRETLMNPWKVSAQFAAFVWYTENRGTTPREEAIKFAKENWVPFLPSAHEGLGRLLIQVARLKPRVQGVEVHRLGKRKNRRARMAVAG
jgi:hypothetical protein